jgi:predicted regulator of Ras-like GTPase activity (Roadblock/LC7/MglB family)
MDAAQALADLTEISSQIEAAVLAQAGGSVVASTFREPSRGAELARAAVELVSTAGDARGDPAGRELVQMQAATLRGSVFVVRDERHVVAAIAGSKPTVGLVFYDLKSCLRALGETAEKPKPKPKRRAPARRTTTRKKTDAGS